MAVQGTEFGFSSPLTRPIASTRSRMGRDAGGQHETEKNWETGPGTVKKGPPVRRTARLRARERKFHSATADARDVLSAVELPRHEQRARANAAGADLAARRFHAAASSWERRVYAFGPKAANGCTAGGRRNRGRPMDAAFLQVTPNEIAETPGQTVKRNARCRRQGQVPAEDERRYGLWMG